MTDDLAKRMRDAITHARYNGRTSSDELAVAVSAECFRWLHVNLAGPVHPGWKRLFSSGFGPRLFLDIPEPPKER